jgi:hypothetical protein
MANDETPAGFLSRWSRRKAEVREGRVLDEPPAPLPISTRAVPQPSPQSALADAAPAEAQARQPTPKPEAPTLADVDQLTPESSYANFMSRDVAPEVKNAAMKKLFSDPHFNVMDRMDIYIDDYGIPDPLPAAMLRQMTSAKFLNLFDDEPDPHAEGDTSSPPPTEVVAQSVPAENPSLTDSPTHDHADLRLQPDAAPRPEGTEPKPL